MDILYENDSTIHKIRPITNGKFGKVYTKVDAKLWKDDAKKRGNNIAVGTSMLMPLQVWFGIGRIHHAISKN